MFCEYLSVEYVNIIGIESHLRVDQGSDIVVGARFSGEFDGICVNSARNVVISKMTMVMR